MPLDVLRLRDSGLTSRATGDEFRAAVLLWCASWHQMPAASLPNDDIDLANLCGYGRAPKEWAKLREGALRGWVLCSDGRLYHPTVAEKAREAWRSKLAQRWKTECARLKKHCQRHGVLFAPLDLDDWIAAGCPQGQRPYVPGTTRECPQGQNEVVPGTLDNCPSAVPRETASKGQGEGQGQGFIKEKDKHPPAAPRAPAREESSFAMRVGWRPSEAFPALLKQAGLVSPTPDALDATIAEFIAYWLTKPEELRDQADWDRTFLKNLKRAKVEADSKPTASSTTPARRTGSRHHGINETNFSEGVSDDGRF